MDENVKKILDMVKKVIIDAKGDFLKMNELSEWDSWTEVKANIKLIAELIDEIAKVVIAAKLIVLGEDGMLNEEEEAVLRKHICDFLDEIIQLPPVLDYLSNKVIAYMIDKAWAYAEAHFGDIAAQVNKYKAQMESIA